VVASVSRERPDFNKNAKNENKDFGCQFDFLKQSKIHLSSFSEYCENLMQQAANMLEDISKSTDLLMQLETRCLEVD
jgi:hypothetical protein